jgi:hypothetical protein
VCFQFSRAAVSSSPPGNKQPVAQICSELGRRGAPSTDGRLFLGYLLQGGCGAAPGLRIANLFTMFRRKHLAFQRENPCGLSMISSLCLGFCGKSYLFSTSYSLGFPKKSSSLSFRLEPADGAWPAALPPQKRFDQLASPAYCTANAKSASSSPRGNLQTHGWWEAPSFRGVDPQPVASPTAAALRRTVAPTSCRRSLCPAGWHDRGSEALHM